VCPDPAALMASTAMSIEPSVPFLKPTDIDSADASSRWTWDSVVRAPMAPQEERSARYWGEMTSGGLVCGLWV
jgi:hypothetical protein